MIPKTKNQERVDELSSTLSPYGKKKIKWMNQACFTHYGFRMKKLEMVSYWKDAYENYISVSLESTDEYGYFSIVYEHSKFSDYVDEIRALEANDL